ncbi:MAG: PadR family transcriptional regulator [Actinomycetota bacterium]|nr:PadR family transcriptional regulator [Actinomycetota bacterium]
MKASITPAMFHVLLALAGGERHGYAIMLEVEELTGGKVKLGPATLYRSIRQLGEAGLIEETGERPDPLLDDERRRYYRLTSAGAELAAQEAARLSDLVKVARKRGLLGGRTAPQGSAS